MRIYNQIFATVLLASSAAIAQQASAPTSPAQAAPAQPVPQPAATQTTSAQTTSAPKVPQLAPPTTMDQVVDRAIAREHALMEYLKNRTPLVETYLQNLQPDPVLGAVPKEDHYFLGRMDMGETRSEE